MERQGHGSGLLVQDVPLMVDTRLRVPDEMAVDAAHLSLSEVY